MRERPSQEHDSRVIWEEGRANQVERGPLQPLSQGRNWSPSELEQSPPVFHIQAGKALGKEQLKKLT